MYESIHVICIQPSVQNSIFEGSRSENVIFDHSLDFMKLTQRIFISLNKHVSSSECQNLGPFCICYNKIYHQFYNVSDMNVKPLASINKLRENAEFGVNRENSGSRYRQSTPIEEFATGLPVTPPPTDQQATAQIS